MEQPSSKSSNMIRLIGVLSLLLLTSTQGLKAEYDSGANASLLSLIKLAQQKQLSSRHTWQVLLHYKIDSRNHDFISEIDDPAFFISPLGKQDPAAELEATLLAFYTNQIVSKRKIPAQCAYPARYRWLADQLNFNEHEINQSECQNLGIWLSKVKSESVSLIFASHYFHEPASMFGHTFLKFNRNNQINTDLLDYSVQFSASINSDDNILTYIWNGTTGGYKGWFQVARYHEMVNQYNNIDNRDLWEYRLNFTPEQVEMMLLHVWEIEKVEFDYFFTYENCSYHLLSLLEIADPELRLRNQYSLITLPVETLKQLLNRSEVIASVSLRPSHGTRLHELFGQLNPAERTLVKSILNVSASSLIEKIEIMDVDRQSIVTDATISFIQYRNKVFQNTSANYRKTLHLLLHFRNQLSGSEEEIELSDLNIQPISPDKSHGPTRLEIAIGSTETERSSSTKTLDFVELSYQPGFHDLLSIESGQAQNSQINFLKVTSRYFPEVESLKLTRFDILDVISLSPIDEVNQHISWRFRTGWDRVKDDACSECSVFLINLGAGLAKETSAFNREVFFAFIEAELEFERDFRKDYRAGPRLSLGALINLTDKWRIALIAERTHYAAGDRGYVTTTGIQQRIALDQNLEIRIDYRNIEDRKEGKFGLAVYF